MINSFTGKLQINIIKIIIIFFKDLTNKQDFILKFVNMVSQKYFFVLHEKIIIILKNTAILSSVFIPFD